MTSKCYLLVWSVKTTIIATILPFNKGVILFLSKHLDRHSQSSGNLRKSKIENLLRNIDEILNVTKLLLCSTVGVFVNIIILLEESKQ